ncbi:unnamed protein product [Allacma fusca]|uniref:Uncharacterized protein n=1 Tax=Allacma fusca TaxID=39272 RepID=A0A8J2J0L2_9HEXA|nr:unnamed protein product [Allacma fusca]
MDIHFTKPDKRLFRDVNLIAGIVMASAILENAFWHAALSPIIEKAKATNNTMTAENSSPWKNNYGRAQIMWASFLPENFITASLMFLSNKLAFYSWNFMDLFIVVLARAMYFKFKALCLQAKSELLSTNASPDVGSWPQLAKDHQKLRAILENINGFLSPLIFLSYGMNIYWISIHMHYGFGYLETYGNEIIIVYKYWSLFHVIARAILVNVVAANVNYWAHHAVSIFSKCPEEFYVSQASAAIIRLYF